MEEGNENYRMLEKEEILVMHHNTGRLIKIQIYDKY